MRQYTIKDTEKEARWNVPSVKCCYVDKCRLVFLYQLNVWVCMYEWDLIRRAVIQIALN